MLEARDLYNAHAVAHFAFTGERLSAWGELSWPEKDSWQAKLDELNEAERGTLDEPKS